MRLRTLPLSAGGVLLGVLLAVADWKVDLWVAVLIVLTTICFPTSWATCYAARIRPIVRVRSTALTVEV